MKWMDKQAWQFVGTAVSAITLIISLLQQNPTVLFIGLIVAIALFSLPFVSDFISRNKTPINALSTELNKWECRRILSEIYRDITKSNSTFSLSKHLHNLMLVALYLGYQEVELRCEKELNGWRVAYDELPPERLVRSVRCSYTDYQRDKRIHHRYAEELFKNEYLSIGGMDRETTPIHDRISEIEQKFRKNKGDITEYTSHELGYSYCYYFKSLEYFCILEAVRRWMVDSIALMLKELEKT